MQLQPAFDQFIRGNASDRLPLVHWFYSVDYDILPTRASAAVFVDPSPVVPALLSGGRSAGTYGYL